MRKDYVFPDILKPIFIALILLLILLNLSFFTINGVNTGVVKVAAAGEDGGENERIRKVYYETDADYPELPKLDVSSTSDYIKSWDDKRYGVDENPRGIIGSAVSSYAFRVPKNWKVKNTFRRFSPGEDMVVFRLEGENGIWGSITKLEFPGKEISDEREFALYYNERKPRFVDLLSGINRSEVTAKLHLLQGFSSIRTDSIEFYESYSTVEIQEDDYANIAQYKVQANLGYVVDVYVPVSKLSRNTRSLAFMIGRSFRVYRFG
ncbi:hypothetical protein K9M06_01675 [Candidatus Bipolaricaulota bacterium]|nr:hypothetical protein [Candidatus Bipolaricaulota bacterium]